MRTASTLRASVSRCFLIAATILPLAWAGHVAAAPTVGFIENWPAPGTGTWGLGGGTAVSNPGTGGFGGAGDGFLLVSNKPFAAPIGTFSSGPEYVGNWTAAGITRVQVWLNDVGVADPIEIHMSLGHQAALTRNFWQYNIGLIPPSNHWAVYNVDLSNAANFTQIQGVGTFAGALADVDRVHFRNDPPPPAVGPGSSDAVAADFGLDHLLLANNLLAVDATPSAVARPVELAPPSPNPSRGPVALALQTFDGAAVRIQVLDAAGRLVRSAELPAGAPGFRIWTWDGAGADGRMAAPGVYRVRAFSGASGGMSRPLVRVR